MDGHLSRGMAGATTTQREARPGDVEVFRVALRDAKSFVYERLLRLVAISVVWFFASIPVVTLGVTTLGAYAAIYSLYDRGSIDVGYLRGVIRRHGVEAVAVSFLPVLFGVGTLLYLRRATPSAESLPLVFGLLGGYLAVHLAIVSTLTLALLARDVPFVEALRTAYLWTVNNATMVLVLVLVTLVLLVGTAALTAGFVLLFPTVAFSLHVLVVDRMLARDEHDSAAGTGVTPGSGPGSELG